MLDKDILDWASVCLPTDRNWLPLFQRILSPFGTGYEGQVTDDMHWLQIRMIQAE